MINISVNTMGGLGNILFQIAAAYSVSLRDNMQLIVDSTNHFGGHYGISKYTNNILRYINFSENKINYPIFGENGHQYSEIPKFQSNTKLNGYFQSEKYFDKIRDEVLNLYSPTNDIIIKINEYYLDVLKNKTTSLHVRRGDYIGIPNYHPTLSIEYYQNALKFIDANETILVFSDDIEWCKSNFDFIKNKIFIDNLNDYEELYLMSICNNNIIANSTFSWWGAWLNQNMHKKVISPKIWFGPSLANLKTYDIYCDKWIII